MSSNKELFLIRIPSTIDIKSLNGSVIDLNKSGNINSCEPEVYYSYECDYNQNEDNLNITKLNETDPQNLTIDRDVKLNGYISFRVNRNVNQNQSTNYQTLQKRHVIEPIESIVRSKRGSKRGPHLNEDLKQSSKKKKRKTTLEHNSD